MKTFIFYLVVLFAFSSVVISQNVDHVNGGRFVKSIEYNHIGQFILLGTNELKYIDNIDVKEDIEKLFFGDFNAPVEFTYEPSFEGASALRIYNDSLKKTDILEIKYISNYTESQKGLDEKYPLIASYFGEEKHASDSAREHNQEMIKKRQEERLRRFQVESICFPVSNQFAKEFYGTMVSLIGNFKAKGMPPTVMFDGYEVTFRTVVEDEVWSLRIHQPQAKARQLSDLLRQIITDGTGGELNEDKYIKLLNEIDG